MLKYQIVQSEPKLDGFDAIAETGRPASQYNLGSVQMLSSN